MKNFYKLNILAIVFCLLPTLVNATERMVDRSLSVDDTMREPSIRATQQSTGDTGFAPNAPIDPNMAKQLQDLRAQAKADELKNSQNNGTNNGENTAKFDNIPPPPSSSSSPFSQSHRANFGSATKNYMNQFCANVGGNGSCKDDQKQQACDRFKAATVNVQQLMDRVIDCEVNAANAIEGDCDGLDAGRLDLLKQYWQDDDMSYTILFLPDMVLNASASCGKKGIAR